MLCKSNRVQLLLTWLHEMSSPPNWGVHFGRQLFFASVFRVLGGLAMSLLQRWIYMVLVMALSFAEREIVVGRYLLA